MIGKKGNAIELGLVHRQYRGKQYVLTDWLEEVLGDNKMDKILIIGDFDIDICENSNDSILLLNSLKSLGLKNVVKGFTRVTNHSATLIDLCFTNIPGVTTQISAYQISDHKTSVIDFKFKTETHHRHRVKIRNYNQRNMNKFKEALLGEIRWDDELIRKDNKYEIFTTKIKNLITVFLRI